MLNQKSFQRPQDWESREWLTVETKTERLEELTAFVQEKLLESQVPSSVRNQMEIVLDELFSNAVKFSGSPDFSLNVSVAPERLFIRMRYGGILFDPSNAVLPNTTLPAGQRPQGGLGIFMVRKLSDALHYQVWEGQNLLTVEKSFSIPV